MAANLDAVSPHAPLVGESKQPRITATALNIPMAWSTRKHQWPGLQVRLFSPCKVFVSRESISLLPSES